MAGKTRPSPGVGQRRFRSSPLCRFSGRCGIRSRSTALSLARTATSCRRPGPPGLSTVRPAAWLGPPNPGSATLPRELGGRSSNSCRGPLFKQKSRIDPELLSCGGDGTTRRPVAGGGLQKGIRCWQHWAGFGWRGSSAHGHVDRIWRVVGQPAMNSPPLTWMASPVMKLAASLHRKAATAATSAGFP